MGNSAGWGPYSLRIRVLFLLLAISGGLLIISSLLLTHLKAIAASSKAQRVTRQGVVYEGPVSRYVRRCPGGEEGSDEGSDCQLETISVPTKVSFILMITWPSRTPAKESSNITFTTLEVKERAIDTPYLQTDWVLLGTLTSLDFRFIPNNSLEIPVKEGETRSISITSDVVGRHSIQLEMTLFSKELEHDPNLYDKLLEFGTPQIQIDVTREPNVLGITRAYLMGIQAFLAITTILAVILNILLLFLARRRLGKNARERTLPP